MQSNKSKKIIIDARMYGVKNGGIGRSIEELIKHIAKIDSINQYYVFLFKENFDKVDYLPSNWQKVLVGVKWYTLKEQIKLPKIIKKIKPDLVYFPHFNVPILSRVNYVVAIHDLIWLKYPRSRKEVSTKGPFLYFLKNIFSKIVFKFAVQRAKKIVCPTQYTKKDIVNYFKINPEKIDVIYWGIESNNIINYTQKNDDSYLEKCYNITKPYLLYVGSAYPHKNLDFLVKSFSEVGFDLQLVLVGKDNYFYQNLKRIVENKKLNNKIIFTDYVDDDVLEILYKGALAFVFPTLVEGFGFPPLEAIKCGTPVLSSNTTCLPEVLRESAIYFDPKNGNDFKDKLEKIINNEQLRKELAQKGYDQIKEYDWTKCAKSYLDLLINN